VKIERRAAGLLLAACLALATASDASVASSLIPGGLLGGLLLPPEDEMLTRKFRKEAGT